MATEAPPRDLVIPVQHSNLGVAVSLEALPADEAEVLQVLQAEQAPLGLWLDFARAYLQQGLEEQGRRVLEDGCSPGAAPPSALSSCIGLSRPPPQAASTLTPPRLPARRG
jgi:hypothetical protein